MAEQYGIRKSKIANEENDYWLSTCHELAGEIVVLAWRD